MRSRTTLEVSGRSLGPTRSPTTLEVSGRSLGPTRSRTTLEVSGRPTTNPRALGVARDIDAKRSLVVGPFTNTADRRPGVASRAPPT